MHDRARAVQKTVLCGENGSARKCLSCDAVASKSCLRGVAHSTRSMQHRAVILPTPVPNMGRQQAISADTAQNRPFALPAACRAFSPCARPLWLPCTPYVPRASRGVFSAPHMCEKVVGGLPIEPIVTASGGDEVGDASSVDPSGPVRQRRLVGRGCGARAASAHVSGGSWDAGCEQRGLRGAGAASQRRAPASSCASGPISRRQQVTCECR